MRISITIAMIFFPCFGALAEKPPNKTWAKKNVSYDQYRRDSAECAVIGYNRDVSKDEPAVRFITGWRAADNALNVPGGNGDSWGNAVARTQPDRRMAEVQSLQTSDVEKCLIQKGYREISLSRSESKKLAGLRKGSETRRRYMHGIAARQ